MNWTLRHRLRAETAEKHQQVDVAFTALDVRELSHLCTFFRASLSSVEAIEIQPGRHRALAGEIADEMTSALRADLTHLGCGRAATLDRRSYDATAVLYVLIGSRAGARLLRRRWCQSRNDVVASAGAYFTLDSRRPLWRELCDELTDTPAVGPAAQSVVTDACALFDSYVAGHAANLQHRRRGHG